MILFTIASREMAERKLVWLAAALVGLAGAALPYLRGLTGLGPREAGVIPVGFILAFVFGLGPLLGASMIPADLANRRLGFFLARPVGTGTLLAGRILGAWLLTAGGAAVVALFQVALHPAGLGPWAAVTGIAALWALPTLLLFHYLGIVWRARSPWALLDLGAMGAFLWLQAWMIGSLLRTNAWEAVPWLLAGAMVLVPVVLAVAAYLQMERGRADLRRGHRAMSAAVAVGLLVVALAGLGFTAWARNSPKLRSGQGQYSVGSDSPGAQSVQPNHS